MKRLLFVSAVGSKFGGAPNSLFHLLEDISKGYAITVIMPKLGGLAQALQGIQIPSYVIRFRIRYLHKFIRFVYKGHYDLIYANGFHYRCILALVVAKLLGKPFVWHIREVLDLQSNFQTRWILRSDTIIANSEASAAPLLPYTKNEKIHVVLNGIKIKRYQPDTKMRRTIREELNIPSDSIIICNIGRVCHQKNQLKAVEIASKVVKCHPNVHFLFLGWIQEQGYVEVIKTLAANTGISSNIHLVGHRQNVHQYLSGTDMLHHTSRAESQGRVILEAMAAKLPVVAYDVGGIKETLIQNKTGFLFPFGSVDPVVDALNMLIQDSNMRKSMGLHGYKHVQQFSSAKTSQKIVSVIEKTIREN